MMAKMSKKDVSELHEVFTHNMTMFPALFGKLADQLGVSVASLHAVDVGIYPVDELGNCAWTFPERDDEGNVIGLSKRLMDGAKYMVKGSERGLTYAVNHEQQQSAPYEKREWARVSVDKPCRICSKSDGCMYPEGEYDNPNAVVCVHVSEGSDRPLSDNAPGYLHIIDKQRAPRTGTNSPLLPSPHPVLIVEGASDVCTAFDLGFVAVGQAYGPRWRYSVDRALWWA
ncbi:MAG: hypothetical protein CEE38_17365 [Planctomycetes bacterium B3_Pla]|nr:MAG: hypothetical protein CEE38_17365 [Planctomycetes bacterium B3_Pla]